MNKFDHPIFDPFSHVETRGEIKLFKDLQERISKRHPSVVIEGDSRLGKSSIIKNKKNAFKTRKGEPIPMIYTSISETDNRTIRDINYNLVDYTLLTFNKNAVSKNLATTMFEFIADKAHQNSQKTAILVLDEAHHMSAKQYRAILNLTNKFNVFDIRIFVISIVNRAEVESLYIQMKRSNNSGIYNRFFSKKTSFKGIRTKTDVKFILDQYDQTPSSDREPRTYTEFFLPKDFKKGFRLTDLTDDIWEVYLKHYKSPMKLVDWPAEHFFDMLNTLLPDYLHQYGLRAYTKDMIVDAIDKSDLKNYTAHYGY